MLSHNYAGKIRGAMFGPMPEPLPEAGLAPPPHPGARSAGLVPLAADGPFVAVAE
jgi:hypothetical protein